jgi:hypothetical protein
MMRLKAAFAAAVIAASSMTASLVPARAEFFGWQVANVASWDVLNVRKWPASYSRILVAYPNGTPLSLTGKCSNGLNLNQIAGLPPAAQAQHVRYRWCEVWVDPLGTGNFETGWVYGRYIRPL